MNKGLIVEITEKEVVVLTKDGSFVSVNKSLVNTLDIGEEITLPRSNVFFKQAFSRKWAVPLVAAACILLMVSILFGYALMSDEAIYAYVHIDINPSLELGLNGQLEVVKVTGLNKEGEALLLFYNHQPGEKVEKVAIRLLELAMEQGYFIESNDVLISTSFAEEQEEYVQALHSALDQVETYVQQGSSSVVMAEEGGIDQTNPAEQQGEVEVKTEPIAETLVQKAGHQEKPKIAIHRVQTDEKVRIEAKEQGISPGKYALYLQAKKRGLVKELEEIRDKSVAELAREIGRLDSLRSLSGKPGKREENGKKRSDKEREQTDKQIKKKDDREKKQAAKGHKQQKEEKLSKVQERKQIGQDRNQQHRKHKEERLSPEHMKQQAGHRKEHKKEDKKEHKKAHREKYFERSKE